MRSVLIRSSLLISFFLLGCQSSPAPDDSPAGRLVTGKRISAPQQRQEVGSLPMNMIATPDGRFVLTSDMGYRQSLWSIRMDDGCGVSHVEFSNRTRRSREIENGEAAAPATAPAGPRSNGLYYGLAAAPDGTVFAAQGAHDSIAVLALDAQGTLSQQREIPTRRFDFPAGLALDDRGLLFVANNTAGGDNPLRSPGSVAIYQPALGDKEIGRCELPDRFHGTSGFPLAIVALRNGSKMYVGSERDDAVYAIDASNPARASVCATINTGARPVGMTLSIDQRRLFVANAQSDSVTIIDTATDQPLATILLRPEQARGVGGVTPVALALSPDQKTLYVALADMNAVAVVNVADAQAPVLLGYISTGWYPSALIATPDGKRLLVADAKGSTPLNPNGHLPSTRPGDRRSYILNLLEGDVRTIVLPNAQGLPTATQQVLAQNSLPAVVRASDQHVAEMGLKSHRIQHVFYVIKEILGGSK